MKKRLFTSLRKSAFLALLIFFVGTADAAQLAQARVTRVAKDVKLLPQPGAPRRAAVSDDVRDGTTVRTGAGSRAELTFTDQTIARLGANTLFNFKGGTRNLNLAEGAMLFQVPKGVGRAKITTAAIAAEIAGTTGIIERYSQAYVKLLLLQGEARVYLPNRVGESLLMRAGQILITNPKATSLPDPAYFDIERLMKQCLLVTNYPALPSRGLIAREQQKQLEQKRDGTFIDTNLVIFGRGTLVSLVDPASLDKRDQRAAAGSTR